MTSDNVVCIMVQLTPEALRAITCVRNLCKADPRLSIETAWLISVTQSHPDIHEVLSRIAATEGFATLDIVLSNSNLMTDALSGESGIAKFCEDASNECKCIGSAYVGITEGLLAICRRRVTCLNIQSSDVRNVFYYWSLEVCDSLGTSHAHWLQGEDEPHRWAIWHFIMLLSTPKYLYIAFLVRFLPRRAIWHLAKMKIPVSLISRMTNLPENEVLLYLANKKSGQSYTPLD